MSTVATFSVPAEAFCLGETLRSQPAITVELDRLVAHSPDYVMPFVWVLDTDRETFEDALADDSTVESATVTDSFETTHLYQMTWTDVVSERLAVFLDHEGVILEARGAGDEWRFEVRFGSRDHFTDFRDHFTAFGEVTLRQLGTPQTPGDASYDLSEKQREALLVAYDTGYFETPSTATGEDVARQLGVSQQAISMRLQRGTSTLIENTLDRHRE